jgi:hypothetical protein
MSKTKSKISVRWVIIAGLVFVASACSPAVMRRDLHYVAMGTEVAAHGSLACDGFSTHAALATSGSSEQNPIMGAHPSDATVAGYFAATSLAVFGTNRVLPDVFRIAVNISIVVVEADAVKHNSTAVSPACGL